MQDKSWREMDPMTPNLIKLTVLVILLGSTTASPIKIDFGHCEKAVKRWASSSVDQETKAETRAQRDLLFFLHIPRTGGRAYFHCFLKKLYSNSQECPRSYDKLRFDPSKPKCGLLASHDDYSMISKLPKERTSVVTILRNPIDRVFSTYEFSVEVAARFLVHPNLTFATEMAKQVRDNTNGSSTLDIWPWKYLVPWMTEDLFARRDARGQDGPIKVEGHDPYNMEEMVIPLHDYINDPMARDIVHNGATFQVAGLTNNSNYEGSREVRHCIMHYEELGDYALEVAKRRLDNMLYVGLTEEHRESATMFGNIVGAQVISSLKSTDHGTAALVAKGTSEQADVTDFEPDGELSQNNTSKRGSGISNPRNVEASKGNMTASNLTRAYETCIPLLRKGQSLRRIESLKHLAPAKFTKEARSHVSEKVLEEIKLLNNLDMDLYEYAQGIFDKQHSLIIQNPLADSFASDGMSSSYDIEHRSLILSIAPFLMLCLFIFAFVRARRTLKMKI